MKTDEFVKSLKSVKSQSCILAALGSAILAFGLYNIHSHADVTEGGILGLMLLFDHHFGLSPAISGLIMNSLCYIFAWRVLGSSFMLYSFVSGVSYSVFYAVFESFDPLFPNIGEHPFIAAVTGAIFVGVGVGIGVRAGAASGGDDAVAMAVSKLTGCRIEAVYLISDLVVLLLSLTYIPVRKFAFSLLTVVLSGQIIGWIERYKPKNPNRLP